MTSQPLCDTTSSHRLSHQRSRVSVLLYHVDEVTAYFRGALFGGLSPAGFTAWVASLTNPALPSYPCSRWLPRCGSYRRVFVPAVAIDSGCMP